VRISKVGNITDLTLTLYTNENRHVDKKILFSTKCKIRLQATMLLQLEDHLKYDDTP